MTIPSDAAQSTPRGFQFRIATLLVVMAWTGLICLGLRSPRPLWSGSIGVLTLIIVLTATAVAIYRTGCKRAMAVGFLVFCVGYLAYLALLSGSLSNGVESDWTPSGRAFSAIFEKVHLVHLEENTGAMVSPQAVFYVNRTEFIAISNYAFATILGLVGAVITQILYATRPREDSAK